MRLSVIVPARNEADVLRPCLESLLAQSEPGFALGEDWELLVVDDGSTDETRSIALVARAGGDSARSRAAQAGLDREGQCGLDRGQKGAGRMAPVYGCRHHPHGREPAAGHPRSGTCAGGDALLLPAAIGNRLLAAGAHAADFFRAGVRLSAGKSLRSFVAGGGRQWAIPDGPASRLLSGGWPRGGGRLPAGGRRPGVPVQAQKVSDPLPLRARRVEHPDVSQLWRDDRGLDQEPGEAIWRIP